MNTAFFGDGPLRRGSPFRHLAVAAALAFATVAAPMAVAQAPAPPAAEAPTATPAAAPADAAAPKTETKENPFTVQHIWARGDVVARGTLILMILMFAGTWYIVATKLIDQQILIGHKSKLGSFWSSSTLDEGLDNLGQKNAFRPIAEGAIQEANNSAAGLGGKISRSERMSHQVGIELERVNARLQAGMAFLATVGAIAPFVGLFGTVWGIVNALVTIGMSGDASIEKVAGPVGEALIMTAIGLAVAVPAVIFYNLLGRRNKTVADVARHFALDVEKLMSSAAKP